jgi:predicted nucleic acid-binding Zn ribbon protein
MNFREIKPVERPISDMRIHIDYQGQLSPPWLPPTMRGGRLTFNRGFASETKRKEAVKRSQLSTILKLDAFKVRDEFHALDTGDKDAVLAFLNATGAFWPVDEVTPEQIREWQEFSKAIHCNNLATMPIKVRSALSGYTQEFFCASYDPGYDVATVLSETPRDLIQRRCPTCGKPFPFDRRADMERGLSAAQRSRHGVIFELVQWFLCPPKGMLMIYPPFRETARQGSIVAPPHAEIEAISVLEAVAACAYLDRFGGVQYRKCKLPDCPKIFKVESEHDQQFCTSSCAATDRQRQKRARDKNKAAAQERASRKKKAAKTKSRRGAK